MSSNNLHPVTNTSKDQPTKPNIVLVGFMGSGKSTIGKKLAHKLDRNFVDLDTYIEQTSGHNIPQLIQAFGIPNFRKIETYALQKVLQKSNLVLATGGGTPCQHQNMQKINEHSISIFLDIAPSFAALRLLQSKTPRPLIQHISTYPAMLAFISPLMQQRRNYYTQATLQLPITKAQTPAKVCRIIMQQIKDIAPAAL